MYKGTWKEFLRQASFSPAKEEALRTFFESYEKLPSLPEDLDDLFITYISLVKEELASPTHFDHFHPMERSPFDFYAFSLSLVRPLIDFASSSIKGEENLRAIDDAIARKENVILLANHQAEIDPQIINLLLFPRFPHLAETMAFIAGHRVTSDPLAIPLSRGNNLFCIYSKKYAETPPEEKSEKLQHNAKTIATLEELFNQGGQCVFVAPSGGRDRYDASGKVVISPFDPSSVELFCLLARRASVKTHIHLLALSTIHFLPPPTTIHVELGEERIVSYGAAHLFFGPPLPTDLVAKEQRKERSDALTQEITRMYESFPLSRINDTTICSSGT